MLTGPTYSSLDYPEEEADFDTCKFVAAIGWLYSLAWNFTNLSSLIIYAIFK